jgi:hypothetical protein
VLLHFAFRLSVINTAGSQAWNSALFPLVLSLVDSLSVLLFSVSWICDHLCNSASNHRLVGLTIALILHNTVWQFLVMVLNFEDEARLNVIEEFSPYLKENTTLHHYKDQLVNAV